MRVIHNWYSWEYRYTNIKKWVLLLLVIVSITLVCIGQQVECGLTVCFYYLRLSTFSHLLRSGYVNLLSTDKSMCMILYFPCRQHKTVMFYSDTLNMLLKTCSLHFTFSAVVFAACLICSEQQRQPRTVHLVPLSTQIISLLPTDQGAGIKYC